MPRRKKTYEVSYPDGWVVSTEYTANNRNIIPGTELSFRGQRGRFRFIKHVVNGEHEWIDVIGNNAQFHSFLPSEIKRVHWKKKTRASAKSPS